MFSVLVHVDHHWLLLTWPANAFTLADTNHLVVCSIQRISNFLLYQLYYLLLGDLMWSKRWAYFYVVRTSSRKEEIMESSNSSCKIWNNLYQLHWDSDMSLELSTVGKIIGKQKNNENANTSTCGRRRETEEKEVRRDDRRRNGEDIILDFPFLVPGSCLFHASLCSSFLTAISRWDRKSITTSSFLRVLRLLRMYVSPVVRSLMSSSPILHTIVHNYSHSNP